MCDTGGLRAEDLELLRQIADGEVEPTMIPRWVAREIYDSEMRWLRGESPLQRLFRKTGESDG